MARLALQKNPFPQIDWADILNQVAAKTKAKDKLPSWFAASGIIYPSKVSVEQTSSEKTAQYKASLISGKTLIDLSGGFGVDDFYFSQRFESVVHCEMNEALSGIVSHNFEILHTTNIVCEPGDSTATLKRRDGQYDWIYIDPSRRNDAKGKVFLLQDCVPNVPELLDFYFQFSSKLLVKTAPILDISAGLFELKNVRKIHIVAVENEVKELLWEIEKGFASGIQISTVNLLKNDPEAFDFDWDALSQPASLGLPQKYLYEPNAAIMKSGGFNAIGVRYGLAKLQAHSHLYTSDAVVDFPGRIFEINRSIPYQKTAIRQWLENKKANVTTRNFPDSVASIRKKWKIKEGGDQYCFFTTDKNDNKIVLICTKIK